MMDGANGWQRFWRVTLPQLRPTLFTVLTLGLIGCWQVFDQIYTGTQGGPGKTTLTPAYLSYSAAFLDQEWGQGAAIAFILFAIIVIFTIFQRWVLRDRPVSKRRARHYELPRRQTEVGTMTGTSVAESRMIATARVARSGAEADPPALAAPATRILADRCSTRCSSCSRSSTSSRSWCRSRRRSRPTPRPRPTRSR